jgi:hypothetical protein
MADPALKALVLAAAAIAAGGCDRLPHWALLRDPPGSVIVKLPPPRAATPRPGFAFAEAEKRP